MSALDRGLLLYDQERYQEALADLALAISEAPDDSYPHALMALCHTQLGNKKAALQEAQRAIELEPDSSYAHYVHAIVLDDLNQHKKAEAAILQALRLDPYNSSYHAAHASIAASQSKWRLCLEAAESGLALDPDHTGCQNLRAHALSILGDRSGAREAAQQAVSDDPDSPHGHASLGWVQLRQGKHREATDHFKEALRLDPDQEYAREGLLEALRARFLPYRLLLSFYTWLARHSEGMRWAIVIGIFVLARIVRSIARSNPELMPFLAPVLVIYSFFVFMTWIGQPLVNTTLLMHPLGRLALRRDERAEAWTMSAFIVAGLLFVLISLTTALKLWTAAVGAGLTLLLLGLATRIESAPKLRRVLFVGLAVLGAALTLLQIGGDPVVETPTHEESRPTGPALDNPGSRD
jgi:Flp pilus assembly protein TadD